MSYLDRITEQLINDIDSKKEEIIKKRIKEMGLKINYELEKTRRFTLLLCEKRDLEETYYFNDGSIEGIRIVTFITGKKDFDSLVGNHISVDINYY